MNRKPLGNTGLLVSELGFGAAALGNEYGDIEESEGKRAVHYAIDQGINYFDVAPFYGLTMAETRLGSALRGKRDSVILATKTGRYGPDLPDGFDFSADRVRQSVEESLSRLCTDYIDVFQVHDIEYGSAAQIINETLPAMQQLREAGKIRCIGITGYGLHMLRKVAQAFPVDTILSYCSYNLLNNRMDEVLTPFVREQGIGLINASPLYQGILTGTEPPDWQPAPAAVREAGIQLATFCREGSLDLSALALQFAVRHETVASTLVSMGYTEEVRKNLQAVETAAGMSLPNDMQQIIDPVHNISFQLGRRENYEPGALPAFQNV